MSTIDKARPSSDQFENRLEFETLISELSSRFINLAPGEVDREIENALRRVCKPLGVDLAVLWQWSDADPGVALVTHVYAPDAAQAPGSLRQEQSPGMPTNCGPAAAWPCLHWRRFQRRPLSTGKTAASSASSRI